MDSDLTLDEPNEAPQPLAGAPAAVGNLLEGRWSVVEIRRGGQAWVLIVDDICQGRRCAIKVPLSSSRTGDAELAMLLGLEPHPHVVTTLDVIDIGGRPGIVLEYASSTLAELLGRHHNTIRPQPSNGGIVSNADMPKASPLPDAFAEILQQLCNGMAHVSEAAETAHLDLKPSNVLIDDAGRGKIADFGLSQQIGIHDGRFPSARGGTWAYSAPEVLRREPCDARADIFSFGVLLYEVCTGMLPYPFPLARDSVDQRAQLIEYYAGSGPKDRTDELYWWGQSTLTQVPVVPPGKGIGLVLSQCLLQHVEERPQNFGELAVMLARGLRKPPIDAEAAALPEADRQQRELTLAQVLIRLGRYDEAVNRLNRLTIRPLTQDFHARVIATAQDALTATGRHAAAAALGKRR